MGNTSGRSVPVSWHRRLVTDVMSASRHVPAVTAERKMSLAPLMAAREASALRPGWCTLFTRAFGLVSRDYPQLRQSYMKFPWPRLYEHPHSIVAMVFERRLAAEDIVLYCVIRGPENRSLEELEELVRHHKEAPLEELRTYQRAWRVSHIPWPARPVFWWAALNVLGRRRCHNFGTFGISSIGSQGAGLLQILPILTSTLHYGLFDAQGRLDVRLTWDHRVMDGATVARVLVDLESVLTGEVARELAASSVRKAA